MKEKIIVVILAIGILLIAAFFRLYGVNWDQNQHLHPDERFLTMVATGISWPRDIFEYLDASISPLNPHNRGFGFFVYGTFPVFFTKWVAESLNKGDYGGLTLIGRQLSALFDLGTVVLVFLIAKALKTPPRWPRSAGTPRTVKESERSKNIGLLDNWSASWRIGLFAAFFYAASVLPIQLSHFYAVETYLTFFITLSFYLLILLMRFDLRRGRTSLGIITFFLGVSFGLALASKISAILFLPIIGLGFLVWLMKNRNLSLFIVYCLLFIGTFYFTVRLAQPYLFANSNIFDITLNPKVLDNWKELNQLMKPSSGFPPSVQWFNVTPILFPLKSLFFGGLGLPLGIISILAITYHLPLVTYQLFKRKISLLFNSGFIILNLSLLWILLLFFYQGIQPAPTIRYFHPIYPFLATLSSLFIVKCINKVPKIGLLGYWVIGLLTIIYPLFFISIYSRPHSRVLASEWIYTNIPYGATIATEHWDDGLPMTIDAIHISQLYHYVSLPLYDPDTKEKWEALDKILQKSDYIVLTSNRLWGSITRVPKIYPVAGKYYQELFAERLGFVKIAEITSYPTIPFPFGKACIYFFPPQEEFLGLSSDKGGLVNIQSCSWYQQSSYKGLVLRDDAAEETFTVYDHPKVLIFKKVKPVDYFNTLYTSAR